MIKKLIILLHLLIFIGVGGFSLGAQAFSCTSNGVQYAGGGTFTIPVSATLNKTTSSIILTDMSAYTTCTGDYGTYYQDALKTVSASLNPQLVTLGYSGFLVSWGAKYPFPAASVCLWPDLACTVAGAGGQQTRPLYTQIGIERTTFNTMNTGLVLPAGTELARFEVTQRGVYAVSGGVANLWSANKTWIFKLTNNLVIPSYTCRLNNANQTVTLPTIAKKDLIKGSGISPVAAPFQLNLSCESNTTVSVQFDGTTMSGKTDVLANSAGGNKSVGIQLIYKNAPVQFGQRLLVINNSSTQEVLPYEAHYYYNGGPEVQAGSINATTTVTITYQ